jgi:ATP:ADP antiporter, AAA family
MAHPFIRRLLAPIVQVREEEASATLLMFAYSFLAMTAYNIVQPLTRARFISSLGSENLPYVLLVSALIIGVLMQVYGKLGSFIPQPWIVPATQGGMVATLVVFWLLFPAGYAAADVAFYLFGQIYAVLLISQFWTLANLIYDPRQAKRLFGFIGGGASLGGILGGSITAFLATSVGNRHLVLFSAAALVLCATVVVAILRRTEAELAGLESAAEEKGLGWWESIRLLRESRHLQIIAVVIGLTSIGAGLIDQQLNMAAEAAKGRDATDIAVVLARVQVYVSAIGFVIQVWLTSRIHRFLGVGFALMILPVGLGLTGVIILLSGALWAPILARVLDKSLRYTVDKTSREILFLPLSAEIKQKAKPFVDVTMDRFARAVVGLLLLVLIKPWGLGWGVAEWARLSYASLAVMGIWIALAVRAKRGYLAAFRQSLARREVQPAQVRVNVGDLSTLETLIEELASPDERRVLYAIDLLETLDKRNLVTPLLLHHDSPAVRARTLAVLGSADHEKAERWLPAIERLMGDEDGDVRAAAVRALANIRNEKVTELARPLLADPSPRITATAAVVLARSDQPADVAQAEAALARIAADTREAAAAGRKEAAAAIRQIPHARFRQLLIPLLYDPDPEVAAEAMQSVRQSGLSDFLFVPALVSLLRHRRLKSSARDVLVSYGEDALDALGHFLRDPDEDVWVRRHLPATIALIPCQKAMDILARSLEDPDGFLRYKAIAALDRLHRGRPDLRFDRDPVERLILKEARRYYLYLSLHTNLFVRERLPQDLLLARALEEKIRRTVDRIYRLLALLYPWQDISAARWTMEHAESRARASAMEYLDNLLSGALRKQLMPILEELPLDEKVRRGNVLLKTRPRDAEETLLNLINDEDPVVSAAAIDLVRDRQMTSLRPDLEHVLAFRDVRDWYVFEAASWTLAAFRLPEQRYRSIWLEPLPAVELANRLRQIPLFDSLSVDELFRFAAAGRQVRYEQGRQLYQHGTTPEALQFLIDGRVLVEDHGEQRTLAAPAALAFEEVLEGVPMRESVRTLEPAVCLSLSSEECRTLLADNTDMLQGLFRMLIERGAPVAAGPVVRGTAAPAALGRPAAGGLAPTEKVLVLQNLPIFSALTADEALQLGAIARDVRLVPGSLLFAEGSPPALYGLLSGEVTIEIDSGPPVVSGPGDAVAVYETLGGIPPRGQARVTREGLALQIDRDDLFDLLGQRPVLLQQLFTALFGAVPRAVSVAGWHESG